MKRELDLWVAGGDLRQEKLARLLAEDGHSVHAYALERANLPEAVERMDSLDGLHRADCVVLPLPVTGEGGALNCPMGEKTRRLEDIFAAARPGQLMCGGMVNEDTVRLAARYGLNIQDYFKREELAVANAVPVALAVWQREKTATCQGFGGLLCMSVYLRRGEKSIRALCKPPTSS